MAAIQNAPTPRPNRNPLLICFLVLGFMAAQQRLRPIGVLLTDG
jgi:hypothetical protein